MENPKDKLAELLNKPVWTEEEKEWLAEYLDSTEADELREYMGLQFEDQKTSPGQVDPEISAEVWEGIRERIGAVRRMNKAKLIKWRVLKIVAASLIGVLALSTYLWLRNGENREITSIPVSDRPYKNNLPGDNKRTVLTLADGSAIALDNNPNGILTKQGNTTVLTAGGKLVYSSTNEVSDKVFYNKLTVPAGRQHQIELPDGSQVWLNAASSLYFPTSFARDRWVELKGEAYFEVAKSAARSFKVKVNGAEVQVLGTHFNVMAYAEEVALKTTLLEGEVNFVNGSSSYRLKPGQQTQLAKNGRVKLVNNVNIAGVVAWKNGMFDFEGADIVSVAGQLSRWYDVEIVFDKKINDLFYARIARGTKLADVLKALELTGKVRFEKDGKRIIVKS